MELKVIIRYTAWIITVLILKNWNLFFYRSFMTFLKAWFSLNLFTLEKRLYFLYYNRRTDFFADKISTNLPSSSSLNLNITSFVFVKVTQLSLYYFSFFLSWTSSKNSDSLYISAGRLWYIEWNPELYQLEHSFVKKS